MSQPFTFTIKELSFDEHYQPADSTRTTTNFANLARGEKRQENLRNALNMINNRFNNLVHWDNPNTDRYCVKLHIISIEINMVVGEKVQTFPMIEMLKTHIFDNQTKQSVNGMIGNNFSSYVRDYDFSILLLNHNKNKPNFTIPDGFGELHGKLFQQLIYSSTYQQNFTKLPVICLSVSDNKIYSRSDNYHPILGVEYHPNESSLTEQYFLKMGLTARYFMPSGSVAPFAFYFFGDLLNDYSVFELISLISTMEAFQKIYRPEIYNANSIAGRRYQPTLKHTDYSLTKVEYDRVERTRLAVEQGKFAEEFFITPHQDILNTWLSQQL